MPEKEAKVEAKAIVESPSLEQKRESSSVSISIEVPVRERDQCRYEHQVGEDGRLVPVGPEILQRFDEAAKEV